MIVARNPPDFRTISDFRKRHLKALGALFLQVLKLCETAGLVKLGHVALDGTKIKANASKHKAMSYERMKKREAELQAEVARMLAPPRRRMPGGRDLRQRQARHEMPDWVGDKQEAAGEDPAGDGGAGGRRQAGSGGRASHRGRKGTAAPSRRPQEAGQPAAPPSDEPNPKSQRNFHRSGKPHHESRRMASFQAYNAQAAVDAGAQIMSAHELTQCGNDQGQLVAPDRGHREQSRPTSHSRPQRTPATAAKPISQRWKHIVIDGYVRPDVQAPTAENGKIGGPLTQQMRKKIDDGGFETPYRLRKQVVEPVFGQDQTGARIPRQFSCCGAS